MFPERLPQYRLARKSALCLLHFLIGLTRRLREELGMLKPQLAARLALACVGILGAPLLGGITSPALRADPLVAAPVDAQWWTDRHNALLKEARSETIKVLFLGDSITDFWHGDGANIWSREFYPLQSANFGIGGDKIENVLWRVENGEVAGLAPQVVVLLIGTNNTSDDSVQAIVAGHAALVSEIRHRLPQAKILVLGLFPRVDKWSETFRDKIAPINLELAKEQDGKTVFFLDFGARFVSPDGTIAPDIMQDGLHLTEKGYQIWTDAMLPTLKGLLGILGL